MHSYPSRASARFFLAIFCVAFSLAHGADRQSSRYSLNIPGQPLEAALQEFARQSGIQVAFFPRVTDGKQAPAVVGSYTLEEGLLALLRSEGLTYKLVAPNMVTIASQDPQNELHRSLARGIPGQSSPLQEVVVRGVAEGVVATRTETALRDIPQTVSVVSLAQIREQNLKDLTEALDRTPGVTTQRDVSTDKSYLIRGFPVTAFHVDGSANLKSMSAQKSFNWYPRPDLSEFERIEVLRGADGLFSGNAPPGGSVNFVRKRPRADPSVRVTASIGSWNNYRLEVDATGALALDGALRGRVAGVYDDGDFFYDRATHSRKKVFAALEYDVTPQTLITLGGSYQRDDSTPVTLGLPWNNDGTDPHVPRNVALTFDWTYYRTRTLESYLQLQQRFGSDWNLRIGAAQWQGRLEFGTAELQPGFDGATGALYYYYPPSAYFSTEPNDLDQQAAEMTLTGAFELLGKRTQVAAGVEYARLRKLLVSAEYRPRPSHQRVRPAELDLSSFSDPRLSQPVQNRFWQLTNYFDRGAFVALKVFLSDAFSLSAGARTGQDRASSRFPERRRTATPWDARVTTPYAALMYAVNDNYSLYASYADIFQRPEGWSVGPDGRSTGTMHGVNIEIGMKAAWRDGALNGTLAAYRLAQDRAIISVRPPGVSKGWLTGDGFSTGIDPPRSGRACGARSTTWPHCRASHPSTF